MSISFDLSDIIILSFILFFFGICGFFILFNSISRIVAFVLLFISSVVNFSIFGKLHNSIQGEGFSVLIVFLILFFLILIFTLTSEYKHKTIQPLDHR
jgi:hypothetical protein